MILILNSGSKKAANLRSTEIPWKIPRKFRGKSFKRDHAILEDSAEIPRKNPWNFHGQNKKPLRTG